MWVFEDFDFVKWALHILLVLSIHVRFQRFSGLAQHTVNSVIPLCHSFLGHKGESLRNIRSAQHLLDVKEPRHGLYSVLSNMKYLEESDIEILFSFSFLDLFLLNCWVIV